MVQIYPWFPHLSLAKTKMASYGDIFLGHHTKALERFTLYQVSLNNVPLWTVLNQD